MESIWREEGLFRERSALKGDIRTEVAVVGGGMAGILTAFLLQRAGKKVVVLEARRVADGQTGNTTAKVTAQHGMLYWKLIEEKGERLARQYAQANLRAVEDYRALIAAEHIRCDWEEQDSFIYGDNREDLKEEARAAAMLGLPCSYVSRISLPAPNAGAVRMTGQAQFHPLKFLAPLAEQLTVYEHTNVRKAEGHKLICDSGSVEAEDIVFACHYPFVNFPGLYFARMHQERSYVLALEGAGKVKGMYLGVGGHPYSFRMHGERLLFGGAGHRAGENSGGGRYDDLRRQAAALFPGCREVTCWSAQDCMPPDHVPYIGRYTQGKPHWYVATGFQKWGMTTSMVAAAILTEQICGREHPCAEVFSPGRFGWSTASGVAGEVGMAVKGLTRRLFRVPEETADHLPLGHGGVVELDGKKVGVYKNEAGELFAVDLRCPHLGCQLEWNPDELSWDCPCHGSRFTYTGDLICGPAQTDNKTN